MYTCVDRNSPTNNVRVPRSELRSWLVEISYPRVIASGLMSIPVAGSVLLRDNQAVVVLSVAQDGAAAPGGPGGGPADNLQMLLNQVLAGDHAVHESRQPLARKHLAAMVCSIQKGLRLAPVGLLGSWSPDASRKFLHALALPKVIRPKKETATASQPAPRLIGLQNMCSMS